MIEKLLIGPKIQNKIYKNYYFGYCIDGWSSTVIIEYWDK